MTNEDRPSPEGVFRYQVPPWPLSRFVESLYTSYTSAALAAGLARAERLPEMAAQLVFMLEDGCEYPGARHVGGNVHASLFLHLGHLTRIGIPLSVREVTAAALRPAGLPLVLPGSAAPWSGRELIAFEEIWGRPALELLERLLEAAPGSDRTQVLQRFLEERMCKVAAPNAIVAHALRMISQSHGTVSVADVADRCGCSVRHLHQLSLRATGLPPKQLARIARAQHLLSVLMSSAKLTEAAMTAGFFDHPHLIRECRALFGCAPAELSEALRRSPELDPVLNTNRQLISMGLALVPRAPSS